MDHSLHQKTQRVVSMIPLTALALAMPPTGIGRREWTVERMEALDSILDGKVERWARGGQGVFFQGGDANNTRI